MKTINKLPQVIGLLNRIQARSSVPSDALTKPLFFLIFFLLCEHKAKSYQPLFALICLGNHNPKSLASSKIMKLHTKPRNRILRLALWLTRKDWVSKRLVRPLSRPTLKGAGDPSLACPAPALVVWTNTSACTG